MVATSVSSANYQTARALMDEARRNPVSPYLGKFVGIANGQIVAVGDNWDELDLQLRQATPHLDQTLSLEVGCDYDLVQEIWGIC